MSGHTDGFRSLGTLLAGGDPRIGEAAFLEGQTAGSLISSRNASTTNALAQARLRVNEARAQDELRSLGADATAPSSMIAQAGFNPEQFTGADLDRNQLRLSKLIEEATDTGTANRLSQAFNPSVVNPLQFGASGGLAVDRFSADPINEIQTTAVGEADIAAKEALKEERIQQALLRQEKRLNPDIFKPSVKDGKPDVVLSKQIAPGTTIIPEGFVAEEGFGAESFVKGGINALGDFFGAGTTFDEEAEANTILKETSSRLKLVLLLETFRPNNKVLGLIETFAENPRELLRGDVQARLNFRSTKASLERSLARDEAAIDSDVKKTATRFGQLETSIAARRDVIADLNAIEASFQETEGASDLDVKRGITGSLGADAVPGTGASDLEVGGTFTLPNGTVVRRTN